LGLGRGEKRTKATGGRICFRGMIEIYRSLRRKKGGGVRRATEHGGKKKKAGFPGRRSDHLQRPEKNSTNRPQAKKNRRKKTERGLDRGGLHHTKRSRCGTGRGRNGPQPANLVPHILPAKGKRGDWEPSHRGARDRYKKDLGRKMARGRNHPPQRKVVELARPKRKKRKASPGKKRVSDAGEADKKAETL